jgi:type I restriction enzyme S subunit
MAEPDHSAVGTAQFPKDWKVVTLGEVAEIVGGSTPSTVKQEYWNGDIPFVSPTDVTNLAGRNFLNSTEKRITKNGLLSISANVVPPGAVLVTSRASIGFVAINQMPVVTNQGFANLICKGDVHNIFVLYLIRFLRHELERLASGSTFREFSRRSLRKLTVPLPPLGEQEKMASILSTVDDAIQNTDEIIAKTQQLKKGLIHQLLTKGIGHTKFKQTEIGKIPDQWDVVPLKNVGEWYSGGTPSKSKKEYWGGRIPWVSPKDMKRVTIDSSSKSITELGLETGSRLVPARSILVVVRGLILARDVPVAMNLVSVAFNQDIKALVCSSDFEPEYVLYALLNSKRRILGMTSMSAHGTKRLPFEELADYGIPHPQLDEQRKIASGLRSVEEKIAFETAMKSHHQALKRGLMQVLLTGKVRVKVD